MQKRVGSEAFSFSKDDAIKVAKGLGLALAGAAITYAAEFFSSTDFGQWTPMVVVASTTALNAARKWLFGTERIEQKL